MNKYEPSIVLAAQGYASYRNKIMIGLCPHRIYNEFRHLRLSSSHTHMHACIHTPNNIKRYINKY